MVWTCQMPSAPDRLDFVVTKSSDGASQALAANVRSALL